MATHQQNFHGVFVSGHWAKAKPREMLAHSRLSPRHPEKPPSRVPSPPRAGVPSNKIDGEAAETHGALHAARMYDHYLCEEDRLSIDRTAAKARHRS